jgi:hypothetical protein
MTLREEPGRARGIAAFWLLVGVVAVVAVSVPGLGPAALGSLASPPVLIRAFLAGAAVVGGLALLRRALLQIAATRSLEPGGSLRSSELAAMVRAIRSVFLAAAAFAAAAGWFIGDPLPLVIALVIAGVDLAETSFLLLIALGRPRGGVR